MASTITREVLHVMKLSPEAITPVRGSALAAGFDLSSAMDTTIPAGGKGLVKTDLSIAIPEGCYARVAPRSGLAWKKFIDTGAGVIDADYRGNVGVILFNHSADDFPVKAGDRIAQLIIERIAYPELAVVTELPSTERGAGGFGSTGVEKKNCGSMINAQVPTVKKLKDDDVNGGKIVLDAISCLKADNQLPEEDRKMLMADLMSSSTQKFDLMTLVLQRYMEKKDATELKEWVEAAKSASSA